jgi:hypothetical protein
VSDGIAGGSSWTLQTRSTTVARSEQLVAGVESTAERSGSGHI